MFLLSRLVQGKVNTQDNVKNVENFSGNIRFVIVASVTIYINTKTSEGVTMGDAADDARDTEELWDELWQDHEWLWCGPDCPYCDPDFEPLSEFQATRG